jgi:hypothetical protein
MGRLRIAFISMALLSSIALAEGPESPAANPPAPETAPSSDTTSPEIWSKPEPGRTRENPSSNEPPPPVCSSPPYCRSRRYQPPPEPDSGESLFEVGLSLGPPTILNLNLGFWGPQSFPMVFRASGMYYGSTRGAQFDVGYAFLREAHFREYAGLSVVSWQATANYYSPWASNSNNSYQDNFTGAGPMYGLNWYGLSVQVGLALGQDVNTQNYSGGYGFPAGSSTTNQFEPEFIFQIGYTLLW